MNKFARWLGYVVESLKWNYKSGVVDFHTAQIGDQHLAEIHALVRANPEQNFIPAIKLHRHYFASSLREAKDAVDEIRTQVGFVRASL